MSEKTSVSSPMVRVASENYRKAMRSEVEREKLIQDYLPLVKSIVVRMRHNFPDHYEMEDIYGVAVRALIVSVNHYNPTKGKSFGNYAALRIRGSLLDELRKIDSLPRANRAKARSLQATIADFEQKHNRTPSEREICSVLKLTAVEYAKLLKETQPISFVPIDGSKQNGIGDENLPLSETLDDPQKLPQRKDSRKKKKSCCFVIKLNNYLTHKRRFLCFIILRNSGLLKLLTSLA